MVNIAEGLGLQPQRTPDHAAESSQRIAQRHGSLNTMVGNGTRPAAKALIQRRIYQSCPQPAAPGQAAVALAAA
jgi:diaminopimelate epimerase